MDAFQLHLALEEAFKLIQRANKYIDETTPWVLAKRREQAARVLRRVMYNLLEALRVSLHHAQALHARQAAKKPSRRSARTRTARAWESCLRIRCPARGRLRPRRARRCSRASTWTRRSRSLKSCSAEKRQPEVKCPPVLPDVTIDEFAKCDMRVCKVLACEAVKKSDKLLKFTLDDGSGTPRQILSGIAQVL